MASDPPANQVVVLHKRSAPSLHSKGSALVDRDDPPFEALDGLSHHEIVGTFCTFEFVLHF